MTRQLGQATRPLSLFQTFMLVLFVVLFFVFQTSQALSEGQCTKDSCSSLTSSSHYLLYDVNPGEGFNLRRDVYVRMAHLVHLIRERSSPESNWILVLPPWGPLYHWFSYALPRTQLPWSMFFDVSSLSRFVPVIEFGEFLRLSSSTSVVTVPYLYTLQHFSEGWGERFEEKLEARPCIEKASYHQRADGYSYGWFFDYQDRVRAQHFQCLSAQGFVTLLADFVLKNLSWSEDIVKSVMFDRAETMLHTEFGGWNYWRARRSMRYATRLVRLGKNDASRERRLDCDFLRQSFSC